MTRPCRPGRRPAGGFRQAIHAGPAPADRQAAGRYDHADKQHHARDGTAKKEARRAPVISSPFRVCTVRVLTGPLCPAPRTGSGGVVARVGPGPGSPPAGQAQQPGHGDHSAGNPGHLKCPGRVRLRVGWTNSCSASTGAAREAAGSSCTGCSSSLQATIRCATAPLSPASGHETSRRLRQRGAGIRRAWSGRRPSGRGGLTWATPVKWRPKG